jgi:hemerythrin superfamily protein
MSQATGSPTDDALDMLMKDHRQVDQLYAELQAAGAAGRTDDQKQIGEQIIAELSVHATVEEQVLYPAAREAVAEGGSLADESLHEHQEMKEILAELDGAAPDDPGFSANFEKLMSEVRHHVDEENELFPQMRSALGEPRLREMGHELAGAKRRALTRPHPHAPTLLPATWSPARWRQPWTRPGTRCAAPSGTRADEPAAPQQELKTCQAPASATWRKPAGTRGAGASPGVSRDRKTTPGASGARSGSTTCLGTPRR